jgi:hypothetical protein
MFQTFSTFVSYVEPSTQQNQLSKADQLMATIIGHLHLLWRGHMLHE